MPKLVNISSETKQQELSKPLHFVTPQAIRFTLYLDSEKCHNIIRFIDYYLHHHTSHTAHGVWNIHSCIVVQCTVYISWGNPIQWLTVSSPPRWHHQNYTLVTEISFYHLTKASTYYLDNNYVESKFSLVWAVWCHTWTTIDLALLSL